MLHLHGFGDVWENPLLVTPDVFCPIFKQRLIDNFTQSWRTDVENNEKITLYKHFKLNFEYERYMDTSQRKHRNALAQLYYDCRHILYTLRRAGTAETV